MQHRRSISVDNKLRNPNKKIPILPNKQQLKPLLCANQVIPSWLLKREDFKKSLQEEKIVKKYNISDLNCSCVLNNEVEKKVIKYHLSFFSYLKGIEKITRRRFLKAITVSNFKEGDFLPNDNVFFIISGKALIDDEISLGPYNLLINPCNKFSSILCKSSIFSLSLSLSAFSDIFRNKSIKNLSETENLLSKVNLFSKCRPAQLQQLAHLAFPIDFPKNSYIFSISQPSQYFYILTAGEAELSSLVTLKTFNRLPLDRNIRETLTFETSYCQFLYIAKPLNAIGIKETIEKMPRCSKAYVLSSSASVLAIKWAGFKSLIKEKQYKNIESLACCWQDKEIKTEVKNKVKRLRTRLNALIDVCEIDKTHKGRGAFDETPLRRRQYFEALQSSHFEHFKSIFSAHKNFNSFSITSETPQPR
ncbi:hypothetical protein SteCoe_33012 [Stentor coeruleus]|uniref:Cyclic nucleotide-binding domain-containing protein n=1 Tax=Stentor coeruleus TaxID=5963 RepID=A0A1R2AXP3_9CILI|nr:hypothetical protein SteCoe_33012 [Stentor coeruleus]